MDGCKDGDMFFNVVHILTTMFIRPIHNRDDRIFFFFFFFLIFSNFGYICIYGYKWQDPGELLL